MKGWLFVEQQREFEAWLKYKAEKFGPFDPDDDIWKYWRD